MAEAVTPAVERAHKAAKRYIYAWGDGRAEGDATMRDLLGGKGAGLAEMTNAGLPVPPGFTITTAACTDYFAAGEELPEGLWEDILEAVADLDELEIAIDAPGPERNAMARDVLRKLQGALDRLPPRAREVVTLRRIEGLSRPEIAQRMGISEKTVSEHLTRGLCALADMLYGDGSDLRGKK